MTPLTQHWKLMPCDEYRRCWSCHDHQLPSTDVWIAEGPTHEVMLCDICFHELKGSGLPWSDEEAR
jgi:hypothetical protein